MGKDVDMGRLGAACMGREIGREGKEREEGKKWRVLARERSLNHSLPGPPRGHKDPLVSLSPSAGLQEAGGWGNPWEVTLVRIKPAQ